jgi:hypothetical protein
MHTVNCQIEAYLSPASLEHTGNTEMVLFFPAGFRRNAEIRRVRKPYIECILSNVWQRRSVHFSEISAVSNDHVETGEWARKKALSPGTQNI